LRFEAHVPFTSPQKMRKGTRHSQAILRQQ
jgi:hypothetical protein